MAIPSAFHGASLELRNLTLAYGPIEVLRNIRRIRYPQYADWYFARSRSAASAGVDFI